MKTPHKKTTNISIGDTTINLREKYSKLMEDMAKAGIEAHILNNSDLAVIVSPVKNIQQEELKQVEEILISNNLGEQALLMNIQECPVMTSS